MAQSTSFAATILRAGQFLDEHNLRGGTRIVRLAQKFGIFDDFSVEIRGIRVHLDPEAPMTAEQLWAYERVVVDRVAAAITVPSVLIDCGASIGIMSVHLCTAAPLIRRVFALEPSSHAFKLLESNLRALPVPATALNIAVGREAGRGSLVMPSYGFDDAGAFMQLSETGDIEIRTVDSLDIHLDSGLVMKIDVEGLEHDVIIGSEQTIRRAPRCVLTLEAHRDVMSRVGDLSRTTGLLMEWRSFRFRFAETNAPVDPSHSIAGQMPPDRKILNVIAESTA